MTQPPAGSPLPCPPRPLSPPFPSCASSGPPPARPSLTPLGCPFSEPGGVAPPPHAHTSGWRLGWGALRLKAKKSWGTSESGVHRPFKGPRWGGPRSSLQVGGRGGGFSKHVKAAIHSGTPPPPPAQMIIHSRELGEGGVSPATPANQRHKPPVKGEMDEPSPAPPLPLPPRPPS